LSDKRVVLISIFSVCYAAVAIWADGGNVKRVVRAAIPERVDVMYFKIRFSVAAHERRRVFAAFAVAA
jgi:hypothetical protein